MLPHLGGHRGNPSSLHVLGNAARDALEEARESVAAFIGASPEEILFTSGGAESDALAAFGLARSAPAEKRHVVVSCMEHAAVREAARRLGSEGFEVSWVGVDSDGLVDPAEFAASLRPDTALAAVVWANNEVGTVLFRLRNRTENPRDVPFVIAVGRVDLPDGDAHLWRILAPTARSLESGYCPPRGAVGRR